MDKFNNYVILKFSKSKIQINVQNTNIYIYRNLSWEIYNYIFILILLGT